MFLGVKTTVGTQLHLSNEKELEAIFRLSNDFIGAQSAAQSCQLCLSEAFYSAAGKDVRLAESCRYDGIGGKIAVK